MHAPLTFQTFQTFCGLEDFAVNLIDRILDKCTQIARFGVALIFGVIHIGKCNVLTHNVRRHRLREALTYRIGLIHHTRSIFERLLRFNGSEGDDLCNFILAIFLGHIVDHFGAAAIVKVHIEVGHRHAVGVEEALKNQIVIERVQIGNTHGVGDHRACAGATPWAHTDTVVLCPVDKVSHHQEVSGEPHGGNNAYLIFRLFTYLIGHAIGESVVQSSFNFLHEPGFFVLSLGYREVWHIVRFGIELDVASFGDFKSVFAGTRNIAEYLIHLFRRAQVKVVSIEFKAFRVGQGRTGLHAQKCSVRGVIFLASVVQIVRRDKRQVEFLGQTVQICLHITLDIKPVIHDLAIEIVLAKDVTEFCCRCDCFLVLPQTQTSLNFSGRTSGRGDEPFRVGLQYFAVHTRLVQLAFQ